MMSFGIREHLLYWVLTGALILFTRDLNRGGGAQAWSYNYSRGPNQEWKEARQWCRDHFIDMVNIRSQEEVEFLNNFLPFNSKYYWIGIEKVDGEWIWSGSNKNVPEENQNWATGEPDAIPGQDCVEMYIKRDKDTAKWNNENCLKQKGIACFSASCTHMSCSAHADCVETVGGYTCKCHPGFLGPRCTEAITCKPLADPQQGSHKCFDPFGSNGFNSSCSFHCKLGFRMVGEPELVCQASGHWSRPVPICQAEQCSVLNHTDLIGGTMNCSHPIKPYSYNSTCEFRCQEGYELIGQDHTQCDHSGQWTASIPACTVKKCSPVVPPHAGNMTCVDTVEPFSFGSQCTFSCQEGYYLTADDTLTCLASGQWSKLAPMCAVIQCHSLRAPPHAFIECQDPIKPYSYKSTCTVECNEGFYLTGTNMTECSPQGNWTHALPVCLAKTCESLASPPHGSLSCSDPNGPFSFGARCSTKCDVGFLLNGTASTECTSLGIWSDDIPHCMSQRCPTLNPPPHGSMVCSRPHGEFSFGSRCTTTCHNGFLLNGTADTECTSAGAWKVNVPVCLGKKCPTLNPSHGSLVCSGPHGKFSFGFQCTSTCQKGFILNGKAETECTSLSSWSTDVPQCLARWCPLLDSPQHGRMNCSHLNSPFSYGSHCDFQCSEGFWLRGTSALSCNTSGHWSQDLPTCQPVQCEVVRALSIPLRMNCSHPLANFSFGSECLFACEDGFSLNGSAALLCTSAGVWGGQVPSCIVEGMSLGSMLLLYAGYGASAAVLLLALAGLALLITTRLKKRGNMSISDDAAWEERENPAFEF
ncbi:P-selectin [Cololabis saira]|uniref:P-selectin n=1 Tax=Cololabis saira TaxID=129043 RepID=UPI002AD23BD0|nr:P-selectin [Cololabis saira]